VNVGLSIDQAISWTYLKFPFRGAEETEGGEGDPNATTGDGTETETSEEKPSTESTGTGKTFTQEEVNALVTRETQKAARGKLDPKELGFASKDELKTFLQKMKDKEEADKSQEDKDREQAIKDAVAEAEGRVLSKANARLIKSEFVIAASKAGVTIPMDDAFQVAQTLEEFGPEVDEEKSTVSGFDDDFFKAFQKAKPYVFARAGASDIGVGAAGGGANKDKVKEQDLRGKYPSLNRQLSAAEATGVRPQ
jgi:hypothetical protein